MQQEKSEFIERITPLIQLRKESYREIANESKKTFCKFPAMIPQPARSFNLEAIFVIRYSPAVAQRQSGLCRHFRSLGVAPMNVKATLAGLGKLT